MLISTSSSGLLLYAALVDLLAEDFLSEEANRTLTSKDKKLAFMFVLLGGKQFCALGFAWGVLTWDCSRRYVRCWRIRLNDDPDEDTSRFHLNSEAPIPSNYRSGRQVNIETEPCWTTSRNTIQPFWKDHPSTAAGRHSPGSIKRKRGKELYLYVRPGRRSEEKNEKGIIEGRTCGLGDPIFRCKVSFSSTPHARSLI